MWPRQHRATQLEPFREVPLARSATTARRVLPGGTVVTPLARRLAGEAGIDLANVKGSGPHGRIVARDVETARDRPRPRAGAAASIVLTADVALGQALALCADVKAIELADVIVKAWATALARAPCRTRPLTSRSPPADGRVADPRWRRAPR